MNIFSRDIMIHISFMKLLNTSAIMRNNQQLPQKAIPGFAPCEALQQLHKILRNFPLFSSYYFLYDKHQ